MMVLLTYKVKTILSTIVIFYTKSVMTLIDETTKSDNCCNRKRLKKVCKCNGVENLISQQQQKTNNVNKKLQKI